MGELLFSPETDPLISCLVWGWGWGHTPGFFVPELAGEVGWVGLSPSVWRLLFSPPLFSTVTPPSTS